MAESNDGVFRMVFRANGSLIYDGDVSANQLVSLSDYIEAAKPAPTPPKLTLAEVQEMATEIAQCHNAHAKAVADSGMISKFGFPKEKGFVIHISVGPFETVCETLGEDGCDLEADMEMTLRDIAGAALVAWKPVAK